VIKKNVDFRTLYFRVLKKFDLGFVGTEILSRIMAGSERSDDYEEVLKHDHFFTKSICTIASQSLKTASVKSLSHGVVLAGQQSVRNMVLGHTISRIFSKTADESFVDFDTSAKKIKFALLAEEQAKKIKNEYIGIALAAGYIFDIFHEWFATESELNPMQSLLKDVWDHSLRAATLAWALASHDRILISHRKIIFASSLLHDIGRLALAAFDTKEYAVVIDKIKAARALNKDDDYFEVASEKENFDLTHPEIGSALIFCTRFLKEIEMEVDFHHDGTLLRMRDEDAFLGGAIINIADRMSCLIENTKAPQAIDLAPIIKIHTGYFPLNSQDLADLCTQIRALRWI
jgi:HD-like signal output (HDOD) protein